MKKYIVITVFLLICNCDLLAQNAIQDKLNTLRKVLTTLKGSARVDCLNEMAQECLKYSPGWVLSTIARADSAYPYAKQANVEAKQLGYVKGIAYSFARLAAGELFRSNAYQYLGKEQVPSVLNKWEEYTKESIQWADKLGDKDLLGQQYQWLGEINFRKNNFNTGAEYSKKAISYFKLTGNEIREGELCTWLCERYSGRGEFEKGFEFCQRSITLTQSVTQKNKSADNEDYYNWLVQRSFVNMANLYNSAGDYEMSLNFLQKAGLYHKAGSSMTTDMSIDKGKAYQLLGNYDSSFHYLKKFEVIHSMWTGGQYNLKGKMYLSETYALIKRNDKALAVINECIDSLRNQKWNKLGNSYQLGKALTVASGILLEQKNYKKALQYASEGVSLMQNNEARAQLMNSYNLLSRIYRSLGNNDSAYSYLLKYVALKDSIQNKQFLFKLNNYKKIAEDERRTGQINLLIKDNLLKEQLLQQQILLQQQNDAQLALLSKDNKIKDQQLLLRAQELQLKDQTLSEQQFYRQQKDAALALLDKDNRIKDQQIKQQTFIRNALLGGLFLLLALGVFVFRSLSLKRKNDRLNNEKKQAELQKQSSELEMQALRAQMNPHFIFNCLSSINRFILKNDNKTASDYLTRFSRLIRMVLVNSQRKLITLEDELEMLRLYLDMERMRFKNEFDYSITTNNTIDAGAIFIPPLLLQPFCENAIWHGLMHKDGHGLLTIDLTEDENFLHCIIKDNGVGRERAAEMKSKTAEKEKSLGLKITTERLALLNGNKDVSTSYKIDDVLDSEGNVAGTKVHVKIFYKESVEEFAIT
ncbi:MAG: histidine kinase [Chitinophagaceae bacterium]